MNSRIPVFEKSLYFSFLLFVILFEVTWIILYMFHCFCSKPILSIEGSILLFFLLGFWIFYFFLIATSRLGLKKGYIHFTDHNISLNQNGLIKNFTWWQFQNKNLFFNGEAVGFSCFLVGAVSFICLEEGKLISIHIPTKAYYVSIVSYNNKLKFLG